MPSGAIAPVCGWKKRICKRSRIIGSEFCELHSNPKPTYCAFIDITTKTRCQRIIAATSSTYCFQHTIHIKRQQHKHREFVEYRSKGVRIKDALETQSCSLRRKLFYNHQRHVDQVLSRDKLLQSVPSLLTSKELRKLSVQSKDETIQQLNSLSENVNLRHAACAEKLLKLSASIKNPYQLANPESVNAAVVAATSIHVAKSVDSIPTVNKEQAKNVLKPIEIEPLNKWCSSDPVESCIFRFSERCTPSCVVNIDYSVNESDNAAVNFVMEFMLFMVENNGVPKEAYNLYSCKNSRCLNRLYCWNHLYMDRTVMVRKCLLCSSTARIDNTLCGFCYNKRLRQKLELCHDSISDLDSKCSATSDNDKEVFQNPKKFKPGVNTSDDRNLNGFKTETKNDSVESEEKIDDGENNDENNVATFDTCVIDSNADNAVTSLKNKNSVETEGSPADKFEVKAKSEVQSEPLLKPDPADKNYWRYCVISRNVRSTTVAGSTMITKQPFLHKPINTIMPRIIQEEQKLFRKEMENANCQRSIKTFNPLPDRKGLLKSTNKTLQLIDVSNDPAFKKAPKLDVTYLIAARDVSLLQSSHSHSAPRPRRLPPFSSPFSVFRPSLHSNMSSQFQTPRFRATVGGESNIRPVFISTIGQPARQRYRMLTLNSSLGPVSFSGQSSIESQNPPNFSVILFGYITSLRRVKSSYL